MSTAAQVGDLSWAVPQAGISDASTICRGEITDGDGYGCHQWPTAVLQPHEGCNLAALSGPALMLEGSSNMTALWTVMGCAAAHIALASLSWLTTHRSRRLQLWRWSH